MENDGLLELAGQVADRRPVDWQSAGSSAGQTDLDSVEQLRILAEIARVHSASGAEVPPPDPRDLTPKEPALFEWAGLQVLQQVGAGTFGEVYRAWDPSLGREVALKLLKADRRQPDVIVREGQMLARVRHVNVMSVYGAQYAEERVGIWSEFLHGRTLAKMVEQDGPLGAEEAAIGIETVCRALSTVHRAGVLHRDVKAQNVMRETGGRIVLMDLGLGRDVGVVPGAAGLELAGTPVYLAPELFEGMPASVRSDIYSLGVLFFYLLTGTFPVDAPSLPLLAAAHRKGERRRLQDLRSDLPAALIDIVERALAVDPAQRFESAGAMQSALTGAAFGRRSHTEVSRPWGKIALVAAAAAAILFTAAFVMLRPSTAPRDSYLLSFSPPAGLRFTQGARNVPAVSPNGKRIAFVATDSAGVTQLWIRSIGESAATPVAGSGSASGPFWSPDGNALAFFTSSGLHKVSLSGARSEKLADTWESRGASWGPKSTIVMAARHLDGLWQLPADGGSLTQLTRVNVARGEIAHTWPQYLPDGRILFFVDSGLEPVRGVYVTAEDGSYTRVIGTDASGLYGDSHLFFTRDSKLFVQAFDLRTNQLSGEAIAVADQVGVTYNLQSAISVSDEGTLLYSPRSRDFRRLVWYNLEGGEIEVLAPPEKYRNPTLSRDGRYLAVEWYDALSEIRVFDLVRGGSTSLRAGYQGTLPAFGPGHELSMSLGHGDLFRVNLDGSLDAAPVLASSADKETTDWSADGTAIVFAAIGDRGFRKLWWVSPGEKAAHRLVPAAPGSERDHHEVQARFSPDGRSIAYLSSVSGKSEIYVRRPWQSGVETRISIAGGYNPVWRGNDQLLYLDPTGTLLLADVAGSGAPSSVNPPRRLFKSAVDTPGASRNHYVLSPDGSRVLFAEPVQDPSATPFSVLVNWRAFARASQ